MIAISLSILVMLIFVFLSFYLGVAGAAIGGLIPGKLSIANSLSKWQELQLKLMSMYRKSYQRTSYCQLTSPTAS